MMMHVYSRNSPTFNKLSEYDQRIVCHIVNEVCCSLEYAAECYLMFDKNVEATKRYIRKELLGARYLQRKG